MCGDFQDLAESGEQTRSTPTQPTLRPSGQTLCHKKWFACGDYTPGIQTQRLHSSQGLLYRAFGDFPILRAI
jgi:hypothetical protein